MKKSKLLIVGALAAFSSIAAGLLINNNVWFMVAASAAIGCSLVVKNSKQVQLQRA